MVDGLERELAGRAAVVRLDVMSDVGRMAAYAYGIRVVPSFLVFDGAGNIVLAKSGRASKGELLQAIAE